MTNDRKTAVLATLKQSRTLIADVADTTRAIVLDDSVGGKVPILKWAVAAKEAVGAFQRERLKRNVMAYLAAFDGGASPEERERLVSELRTSDSFNEDFTDTVVAVLLDAAKPLKAQVLGYLTASLAAGALSKDDFRQLALIIEAASVPSLLALESHLDRRPVTVQLMSVAEEPLLLAMGVAWRYGSAFKVSLLGQQLYTHGFKKALKPSGKGGGV